MLFIFQSNTHNFYDANSQDMCGFVIKPNGSSETSLFCGDVGGCDAEYLYLKITKGFDELCYNYKNDTRFDVYFHINRNSYQLQHNALYYMKEHDLFPVLINNKGYLNEIEVPKLNMEDNFR